MSETRLLEEIKKQRREAISRSDKKYSKQFLQPRISKKSITVILVMISICLLFSTVMVFREPPKVINNLQEVTYINQIQNVTEHIIR